MTCVPWASENGQSMDEERCSCLGADEGADEFSVSSAGWDSNALRKSEFRRLCFFVTVFPRRDRLQDRGLGIFMH